MEPANKSQDTKVIFRPYITVKGKRIYAYQRGLKAFPIRVKVEDPGKK